MRRTIRVAAIGLAIAAGLVGCKKAGGGAAAGANGDGAASSTGNAADALLPVGMSDPFAHLTGDAAKSLNAGYKALRAKKYDEARAAFHAVVAAVPDYTAARWQEARAAALDGKFADVPALWGELMARDAVGYSGRLDKAKDVAPLRAAPEWAKVKDLEARYRGAYAAGLTVDKGGFFFVARARAVGPPRFTDAANEARLDLTQEAWFYDVAADRYRRVTDTDGHVFSLSVSPDKKTLLALVVPRLGQNMATGDVGFVEAKVAVVDLSSLTTIGPLPIAKQLGVVGLCFSAAGDPRVIVDSGEAWALDATRTALVKIDAKDAHGTEPGCTASTTNSIAHYGPPTTGAKLTDGNNAVAIDGVAEPLRAARALSEASLEWSPSHKRLAYAGALDACKALKPAPGTKADKNELYLWDATTKAATRVAVGISSFETLWLDDDHLVYENGFGKDGQVHVYDVPSRTDKALKTHAGAGLFGFPDLSCDEPATAESEGAPEGAE